MSQTHGSSVAHNDADYQPIKIIPDQLYLARETQDYLRTSRTTLWKLEKAGKLVPLRPGGKILVYRGADILAFLAGGK